MVFLPGAMNTKWIYILLLAKNNKWLRRQYPKLVHFGLHFTDYEYSTDELKSFFVRNPNIRKLAAYADNLIYSPSGWLDEANLQLDDLALTLDDFESGMYETLYKTLPKNTFSKRMQLYEQLGWCVYQEYRHEYVPIELDKCPFGCELDFDFYPVVPTSLREICVTDMPMLKSNETDFWNLWGTLPKTIFKSVDEMANKLVNLERISDEKTTWSWIEALAAHAHAPKLVTIKVLTMEDTGADIDLQKCNQRREALKQSTKVVIYVDEATYLSVKSAKNDMQHRMVAMKRLESCKWEHDFDLRY